MAQQSLINHHSLIHHQSSAGVSNNLWRLLSIIQARDVRHVIIDVFLNLSHCEFFIFVRIRRALQRFQEIVGEEGVLFSHVP